MTINLKHDLRKRPTYDEMLKQAITSKMKTTVIPNIYKEDILLHNFDFERMGLMILKIKKDN